MYLTESLESMARILRTSRIVVAGGINLDIQGTSSSSFRAADSNPGDIRSFPGGVGRNIAENLVRLGCSVELVAAVGDDEDSRALISGTGSMGIGVSGVLRVPGASCPRYLCLLDPEGGLVGAVADMAVTDALGVSELEARRELFDRSDAIVVDANLGEAAIAWFARNYGRGRTCGKGQSGKRPLLVFDPVSVAKAGRAAPCIGAFDLVKPNRAEARVLAALSSRAGRVSGAVFSGDAVSADEAAFRNPGSGSSPDSSPDWPDGEALRDARSLLSAGTGAVHLSLGAQGLIFLVRDESPGISRIPCPDALPVTGGRLFPPGREAFPSGTGAEILSVSGAGDAACAALVAASLAGLDPVSSGALALAASSLCATSRSTVHPDLSCDLLIHIAQGVVHEPIPRYFI